MVKCRKRSRGRQCDGWGDGVPRHTRTEKDSTIDEQPGMEETHWCSDVLMRSISDRI